MSLARMIYFVAIAMILIYNCYGNILIVIHKGATTSDSIFFCIEQRIHPIRGSLLANDAPYR